jgi:hypothetical protein
MKLETVDATAIPREVPSARAMSRISASKFVVTVAVTLQTACQVAICMIATIAAIVYYHIFETIKGGVREEMEHGHETEDREKDDTLKRNIAKRNVESERNNEEMPEVMEEMEEHGHIPDTLERETEKIEQETAVLDERNQKMAEMIDAMERENKKLGDEVMEFKRKTWEYQRNLGVVRGVITHRRKKRGK